MPSPTADDFSAVATNQEPFKVLDGDAKGAPDNAIPGFKEPPADDARALGNRGGGVIGEVPWSIKSRSIAIWSAYRLALAAREFYRLAAQRVGDPATRTQYERASRHAAETAKGLEHWFPKQIERMALEATRLGAERLRSLTEELAREQTEDSK